MSACHILYKNYVFTDNFVLFTCHHHENTHTLLLVCGFIMSNKNILWKMQVTRNWIQKDSYCTWFAIHFHLDKYLIFALTEPL